MYIKNFICPPSLKKPRRVSSEVGVALNVAPHDSASKIVVELFQDQKLEKRAHAKRVLLSETACFCLPKVRKRKGVHKSMGARVPWKTGMLIYLPVTSRPLIFLQKEAV